MATPKPNLVDQRQRDLAAYDVTRGYCVEAAAGTGKTTLLVQRLLSIIGQGAAELSQIAAITFTEKAAAELRVRLRDKLEESRRKASPPECDRFAKALEQLDRASLSTIHAFAASLLRERPVEAGIDPGFEQLDEMGCQLLLDEVWQAWKQRQLESPPPILQRLLSLEITFDTIKSFAERLLINRDLVEACTPPPSAAQSPLDEIWSEVTARVRQLEQLEASCTDPADRGFLQIQRLKEFVNSAPASDLDRERALLLDFRVDPRAGVQKNWSSASVCNELKQIVRELKTIVEGAGDRLGPGLANDALQWLRGFLDEVEQTKRARGVLDFQDLLLRARNLVRDDLEVRAYFQQKIRYLLVDEFQDTDPLQAELVFFLAEERAEARDWREVRLAPGKLFLVGDPKQSIYRFRRADVQVYERAKGMLQHATADEPLIIRQNFRSSPWLLQAVNQLFEPQMIGGDYQAAYVTLEPAPDRPNAGPGLALLFPAGDYIPGNQSVYLEAEAGLLAALVRQVGEADSALKVWDKHKRQARPARYGDIALLFPVTNGLPYYEHALRAHGVPFQLDAGRQFYQRREVRDLLSVLTAIDNPENAIALVAALRSPFFGLSDADLFLYRHAGGQLNYLRTALDGFPSMAESLRQLRRWHGLRASASLSGLLESVLDESNVLSFLLLTPEGEQAVANLLRLVELARRFEPQSGACLRSFVRWLEQRAASELAESEAGIADEQTDAVHLLTIHAAKGLEFPIVALAGMACSLRYGENLLFDHARGEIAVSFKCGDHRLSSANFAQLAAEEEQRGRAEDLRLFYVAATRAKDCLIVPRVAPRDNSRTRFLDFFQAQLDIYGGKPERTEVTDGVLRARAEDLPAAEAREAVLRRDVGTLPVSAEVLQPVLAEREAWQARLAAAGICPAPTASLESRPPLAEEKLSGDARGRALGTAFHRIMQEVEIHDEPLLDAIIESAATAAGVAGETSLLREWVRRALTSPLWQRVRQASRVWREVPFCMEQNGQVVEGIIDLLFQDAKGLALVDYKTDEVTPETTRDTVEAHRAQLETYREAVRQLTGEYPKDALIYFVRAGCAVEL